MLSLVISIVPSAVAESNVGAFLPLNRCVSEPVLSSGKAIIVVVVVGGGGGGGSRPVYHCSLRGHFLLLLICRARLRVSVVSS